MADNIKFEEVLKKLEGASEKLKSSETPLEDALKSYEEGVEYYKQCKDILDKANQRIEVLSK